MTGSHDLTKLPGIGWARWKCFNCGMTFKRKPHKSRVCVKAKKGAEANDSTAEIMVEVSHL